MATSGPVYDDDIGLSGRLCFKRKTHTGLRDIFPRKESKLKTNRNPTSQQRRMS